MKWKRMEVFSYYINPRVRNFAESEPGIFKLPVYEDEYNMILNNEMQEYQKEIQKNIEEYKITNLSNTIGQKKPRNLIYNFINKNT